MNDLVDALGLAQPQVSKHLRVLREVGAVDVREEGRRRLYSVNGRALKPIHDWVKNYERTWSDRFELLDAVLDELKQEEAQGEEDSDEKRVGGRWRYVMVADGGFEVAFHGEYREIVPNERLVSTEVYEAMPDAQALDTVTFAEENGRTLVTLLVQHTSKEHRDAHVGSGMEDGLQDALDLLEQVAVSLR